jgi:hypothetical protein
MLRALATIKFVDRPHALNGDGFAINDPAAPLRFSGLTSYRRMQRGGKIDRNFGYSPVRLCCSRVEISVSSRNPSEISACG